MSVVSAVITIIHTTIKSVRTVDWRRCDNAYRMAKFFVDSRFYGMVARGGIEIGIGRNSL